MSSPPSDGATRAASAPVLQTPEPMKRQTSADSAAGSAYASGGNVTDGDSSDSDSSTRKVSKLKLTPARNPMDSVTSLDTPRSTGPIGRTNSGSAKKEGKAAKKVDAFSFDAGDQGFDRSIGTFPTWNPSTRLPIDAKPQPSYCIGMGGMLKSVRGAVSKKKKRFTEGDFDLDLTYITPKIIAMGFPSVGREGLYRNPMAEVQRFFETRHAGRYRIYNLCSERAYDPSEFLGRVARFPFDDHNPCPLHLIAAFCEDVDAWLNAHPDNVVSVHCKAGKGRTGLAISAYLVHCGFKASSEQALKFFGMQRTANGKGVTIPSQMRYVHYYEAILRRGFPVTYTYRIHHVRMRGVPAIQRDGACAPWFQIFVDGSKVFDFKKAVGGAKNLVKFKKGEPYMDMDLTPFDVRVGNNVKFQFNHEGGSTVKLCHIWFHTGFITRNYLVFGKNVVDKANKDKKGHFPKNFALEFYLSRVEAMPLTPGEQEAMVETAKRAAGGHVSDPSASNAAGSATTGTGGGATTTSGSSGDSEVDAVKRRQSFTAGSR